MISDFQLALGGAVAALVVGVLVYNRWQESKYKRRAERAFATDHSDVLLDSASAKPAVAAAEPKLRPIESAAVDRVEPVMGTRGAAAMAAVPDDDDIPPPEAVAHLHPGDAKTYPAPQLSAEIDSLALILADTDVRHEQYQAAVAHSKTMGKGVRWEGLVGGLWQSVTPDTKEGFRELRAGMQLANRGGAADANMLGAFDELIAKFAASVGAVSQREGVATAVKRAAAVDAFCADTDVEIAVNVIGQSGVTFAVTKVRGLAESKGMLAIDTGEYVMRDEHGHTLFTLRNFDPAEPPGIKRASAYLSGLTFALDVPRTLNGSRVFPQMLSMADHFAHILQGEVVDDNRRALTANGRKVIADTIAHISTQMEGKAIEPGGSVALRLYA